MQSRLLSSFVTSPSTIPARKMSSEAGGVVYVSSKYAAKRAEAGEGTFVSSAGATRAQVFASHTSSDFTDSYRSIHVSASRSLSQAVFPDNAFRVMQRRQMLSSRVSISESDNIGRKSRSTLVKIPQIELTEEEMELFALLKKVVNETNLKTTLRVAGGWVRDKLLATKEFRKRFEGTSAGGDQGYLSSTSSSNLNGASKARKGVGIIGSKSLADDADIRGCQQPVDIDIALDNMLGREFADHLNEWLTKHGHKIVNVGMILKNPEKSKHLETATMRINQFWIDFVNLRAEEYTDESSRIPDLMRIGTAEEDAFRRDLTINSLFYNINSGVIEDLTGSGVQDLFDGVIATPLHPLTTLLDDPLRVLRSIRFAARLRFSMSEGLRDAARDPRVHDSLAMKVSRERVGGELDLMMRSYDPVGAMRLLINLNLVDTVFPVAKDEFLGKTEVPQNVYSRGLVLLSTTHDHLCECKTQPPVWCQSKHTESAAFFPKKSFTSSCSSNDTEEVMLINDEESRRLLWYAAFLKPLRSHSQQNIAKCKHLSEGPATQRRPGKKAHQSIVMKLLIDDLKRPVRDAEDIERIQSAADDFSKLIIEGGAISASSILLNKIKVRYQYHASRVGEVVFDESSNSNNIICTMTTPERDEEYIVHPLMEQDPRWLHAMEFRLLCSKILQKINHRWRPAIILSLSEQLSLVDQFETTYAIEGDVVDQINEDLRQRIITQYNAFASALVQLGLVGIWNQKPLIDGDQVKQQNVLPHIKSGPMFREVIDEQVEWMILHPGGDKQSLIKHLQIVFPAFAPK
jgi:tRNA nucleotidyltransferase/poly(A) polymerase